MTDVKLLAAILDSLKGPVLFADTEHVTRYMNKAAIEFYDSGAGQIGRSLLDCHNEDSQKQMVEILAAMQNEDLEEQLITVKEEYNVYMRAIRDGDGKLLGYYERYEPPPVGRETQGSDLDC